MLGINYVSSTGLVDLEVGYDTEHEEDRHEATETCFDVYMTTNSVENKISGGMLCARRHWEKAFKTLESHYLKLEETRETKPSRVSQPGDGQWKH